MAFIFPPNFYSFDFFSNFCSLDFQGLSFRLTFTYFRLSKLCWIKTVRVGHLFLILEEILSALRHWGFPDSSVDKESACNAGDPGLIAVGKICWRRDRLLTPVFLGFPCAHLVKNPPETWETWVRSLGWEDPLEKGKATHSGILAWRIPWTV